MPPLSKAPPRGPKLGGAPPTIGLFVDWLEDHYQCALVRGAHAAARDRGANLLVFAGGMLGSRAPEMARRNRLYDLVGPETVDVLVLVSGTLGNVIGPEELARFCDRFRPVPMCSIAVAVGSMPSVLVDNDAGMRDAITHLVRVHGFRRIAFIRGPRANQEAERRFCVYRDMLAEHRIALDVDLVLPGDFQRPGGAEAVRMLLDERRVDPASVQAIVAANDELAIGALEELSRRAIRVPGSIALVGFDDVEDARFTDPPLTTVRQPLEDQGRQAVRTALAMFQGGAFDQNVTLSTELVVRRSCGCFGPNDIGISLRAVTPRLSPEATLLERREIVLADLNRAARATFGPAGGGWDGRLWNALVAQIGSAADGPLVEALDDLLRRLVEARADVSACEDVVSTLRRHLLACIPRDADRRAGLEDILHQMRILTGDALERSQARQRLTVEGWARTLTRVGAALLTSFDMDHLVAAIKDQLPKLGVDRCLVALYARPGEPISPPRVLLAYDPDGPMPADASVGALDAVRLLPQAWRNRAPLAVVAEPLFHQDEQLGFVLFGVREGERFAFDALRELISGALQGALLLEQVLSARARLSEYEKRDSSSTTFPEVDTETALRTLPKR